MKAAPKKYLVKIETSVEVEADTPKEAAAIATAWAQESLSDSNALGKVWEQRGPQLYKLVHKFEV